MYRLFSSIPSFGPLDARSYAPSLSGDSQKCLQTFPLWTPSPPSPEVGACGQVTSNENNKTALENIERTLWFTII